MAEISRLVQVGFNESQSRIIGSGLVGEIKAGFFATAPEGWLLLNGTTIGNAASGATARANPDTFDLFSLLWTNISDTYCPVSSGRGASAAADFAANKTLTLPNMAQRMPIGKGASGVGAALGETGGNLNHTHTGPSHTHTGPSHSHTAGGLRSCIGVKLDAANRLRMSLDGTVTFQSGHYWGNTADFAEDGTTGVPTTVVIGSTGAGGTGSTGAEGTGATGTNNQAYLTTNFIIAY